MRSFGSDNNSGIHPQILQAIIDANHNHAVGYGNDEWTEKAKSALRQLIGLDDVEPFFVFNGTGANIIALQACTRPFHSIICASTSHIAMDECGAPTLFTSSTLKEIETVDGKLTTDLVMPHLKDFGVEHHSQPKVIAVSQTTEMGTAYLPQELKALADLAHNHDMYLFVDGTRIANACAYNRVSLREMVVDSGVDILTFGGTKNGLMIGEVIVPLHRELADNMKFIRKQSAQLYSKMRYLSAQFIPYFSEGIWIENAQWSNRKAQQLAEMLQKAGVELTQPVQSNAIFFRMDKKLIDKLRKDYFFYAWDEAADEYRLVCSWDTTDEDIEQFISRLSI